MFEADVAEVFKIGLRITAALTDVLDKAAQQSRLLNRAEPLEEYALCGYFAKLGVNLCYEVSLRFAPPALLSALCGLSCGGLALGAFLHKR